MKEITFAPMKVRSLPAQNVSPIISDYIGKKETIRPFSGGYFSHEDIIQKAIQRSFPKARRECLQKNLIEQYNEISISDATKRNIDLLQSEKCFTITTGHQLCLLTGPLYFIYKIASAIRLSWDLKRFKPEYDFVPVYWMATVDHDLAEIDHVFWRGKKLQWQTDQKGAVGPMSTEGISNVIAEVVSSLGRSQKSSDIARWLEKAYTAPDLSSAVRILVNELFGQYGLVVIDANRRDFKSGFSEILKRELFTPFIFNCVTETGKMMQEAGYHALVNPREINLFYMAQDMRERIIAEGSEFKINNTDIRFTEAGLQEELDQYPERFSPNVLFRPIYQEFVLPNLAYIGGPAELSYWMQTKSSFETCGVDFPALILRDQATWITSNIRKKWDKLEMPLELFFDEKEKVVKEYVSNNTEVDIEAESAELMRRMDDISAKLSAIDKTLEASVQAEKQKLAKGLENLNSKLLRSGKQRLEQSIQQIESIFNAIKPDGILQERRDNFLQFQSDIEEDMIAILIENFNPLTPAMKVFIEE